MRRYNTGWVLIARQLVDNPIYYDKGPFDATHAWIDLILLANHVDHGKYKRGHVYASKKYLSERWHWDRKKVSRFLEELAEEKMIILISVSQRGIILKITNYDRFQRGYGTTNGTTKNSTKGTIKRTTFSPPFSPCESKDSGNQGTTNGTTNGTTDFGENGTTNKELLTNNNLKEIQIKNTLSLMERRGIQKDKLSPDAKEVYEKISKGEEVDFSKYEDEDGAMDANIMHIMSVLEEI